MRNFLDLYRTIFDDPFFADFHPVVNSQVLLANNSDIKSNFNQETGENKVWISAPGFSKDEINVEAEGNRLTISGEIKNEETIQKIGEKNFSYYIVREDLDPNSIEAGLKDGILEIGFKTKKKKSLKKVDVKLLN